jgi:2-polyprenyl-6-methoxyphenol hydroxylase-like FAD-dependent oxidoreductase
LIVGGGIAGLSLAAALTRQGFEPELVERADAWPVVGAGFNLPANGVRVLTELELGDAVAAISTALPSWSFVTDRSATLPSGSAATRCSGSGARRCSRRRRSARG